jgi:hypothetical protein
VLSKNFHPVALDYIDYSPGAWDTIRSAIGWNWKYIDTNYVYHVVDSSVYFVKTQDGDIYKMVFEKFAGGSSGLIVFETAKISGLGIQGNSVAGTLEIYPNPAVNVLKVSWLNSSTGSSVLALTDMSGRRLIQRSLQTGSGQLSLDVSGLGSGIYFLTISSPDGNLSKKVVISR